MKIKKFFPYVVPPKLEEDIPKVSDDWSPYPSNYIPDESPASNDEKPTNSVVDLFDNDLEADDIFTSKTATIPISEPEEQIKPIKTTSPANPSKKVSLFGDDNDDDDLFGGSTKPVKKSFVEPAKQVQPKKVATKIFSDDLSDDDLFGGGKAMTKHDQPKHDSISTVKNRTNTKIESKASDKLFSESESDDDDLFGSKSKPKS